MSLTINITPEISSFAAMEKKITWKEEIEKEEVIEDKKLKHQNSSQSLTTTPSNSSSHSSTLHKSKGHTKSSSQDHLLLSTNPNQASPTTSKSNPWNLSLPPSISPTNLKVHSPWKSKKDKKESSSHHHSESTGMKKAPSDHSIHKKQGIPLFLLLHQSPSPFFPRHLTP
jgi:hypothetical protein